MRLLALWALVASLSVSTLLAQSTAPDPELQKAGDARTAAQRAGDAQAWGRYTTDDFLVTGVDGVVKNKSQRMAEIKGNTQTNPNASSQTDQKWRMYGTTAIHTGQATINAAPTRITTVWVKQNGGWKVAAVHLSTVAKP